MEEVAKNRIAIVKEARQLLCVVLGKEADIHPICHQVWNLVCDLQKLGRCSFADACMHFALDTKFDAAYVAKIAKQGSSQPFSSSWRTSVAKAIAHEKEVVKERTRAAAATATRTVEVAKTITDTLEVSGDAKDEEIARLRARVAELEARLPEEKQDDSEELANYIACEFCGGEFQI